MDFLKEISPRLYQEKIFETCSRKNCLVVLPTGLGKTLIALMLTIHRMKEFPGEKVLFLAPTKPLAEQHLQTFKKHLPELFAEMTLFTGAVNAANRQKLWQNSDIIFSTPQCVANDLNKGLYNLSDVCLLVEDEAHRCVRNYDYNLVAQKYYSQAKNKRIIGMTASPGNDIAKIKEICKNLFIEDVELRTRDSDDVKEYLQELEFQKVPVTFPPEFEEIKHVLLKLFDRYIEELRKRSVLFGPANKASLIMLQKKIAGTISRGNKNFNYLLGASACAQAIKLQHALELLETQTLKAFNTYLKKLFQEAANQKSRGVVRLVSNPEFNFMFMSSNELLAKGKEHPKIAQIVEIVRKEKSENPGLKVIVFTQFRNTAADVSKVLNEIEGITAKVFVGQAKRAGDKENTGLTQEQQKKIIQEFSDGEINVLCATCIAEEGLDIPEVNAVIFYEPVPSAIRAIQRTGRTARLMPGKLIMLITKKTRDETSYYVSRSREKKMHKAIDIIKQEFSNKETEIKSEQKKLF